MSRFNNTGMYGTYTHLMQFFAFYLIKRAVFYLPPSALPDNITGPFQWEWEERETN